MALKHWIEGAGGYRNTCFISWPSRGGPKVRRLVEKLKQAIEEEAPEYGLPSSVFTASDIPGGMDWESEISLALCQSIALVAVCGPEYYDSDWCGREWAAMLGLAKDRLGSSEPAILPLMLRPLRADSTKGLLQAEVLPNQVSRLQCWDLSRIRLRREDYEKTDEFADLVGGITRRIDEIARRFAERDLRAVLSADFVLPSQSAFSGYRQRAQIFPYRTELPITEQPAGPAWEPSAPTTVEASLFSKEFEARIITFYSFKGGVGRSMAVANMGRLLARDYADKDRETLLIDWDLEAPGLHRYFPLVKCSNKGLIDYFQDLIAALNAPGKLYGALHGEDRARVLDNALPFRKYVVETGAEHLTLMTAGPTDPDSQGEYQRKVAGFDWLSLFYRYPLAIRAFREMLKAKFQYTLIDSRTGISDTAGVCTAILPDRLVAMFGPNKQNESILGVVEAAIEFRRMSDDDRPLIVLPVASRFDTADLAGFHISRKTFLSEFSRMFTRLYALKSCDMVEYFEQVLLLYVPYYSNREAAVVDYSEPTYLGCLGKSYEAFAQWLVRRSEPWTTSPNDAAKAFSNS
jgi:hypothetical protein